MTNKRLIAKLDRIIKNSKFMFNISGEDEDGKIYHAYGEGAFPVRVTQRQVSIIADYLSYNGYNYWFDGPIVVNPKATYLLWVNIRPETWLSSTYKYSWGFRRLTESSEDNP